jgi:O-antigen/teichoic acid export membrane protein
MSFAKEVTLNTLASSAGRVIGSVFAIISVGFLTRALGREGFGEYSTVVAYLATFQLIADLGLYTLLTREISQKPTHERELVSYFFTLRLTVAVLVLAVGAGLVFFFPYSSAVKWGAVYAASAFVFLSLTQVVMGVFQKHLQTYKAAIAEVAGRAVQLAFVAAFFFSGGGLFHFLTALIAASFVIFAINLVFVWRLVRFRLAVSFPRWRAILKTTFPIAVSLVFTLLYFRIDILLLSILKTPDDVGIYSAAYRVLEALIFFPAAFIGVVFPRIAKYAKESPQKLSQLLSLLTDLMTVAVLPAVVGGTLLASTIVSMIGGEDFLISAATLRVLFLAIGIIFYGTLLGNSVVALGLQKKAMWAYAAGFVFNIAANLAVIPRYSYIGAAWTTVATELLVTAYLAFIVYRAVPFHASASVIIKAAFAAAVMGGVVWWFARPLQTPLLVVPLLGTVFLAGALYATLAALTKAIATGRARSLGGRF